MWNRYKMIVLISLFTFSGLLVQAQPGPGTTSGGGGVAGAPIGGGVPIGGGLCLLLALGVAYGASKFYNVKDITATGK